MSKAKRIRKQKAKNKKLKNMAKIREQRRAKIKNWIRENNCSYSERNID